MTEKSNSLTSRTISSVIWKFAEQLGAKVITMVVSIVLARILMPEDYGIITLVTIFITLCDVFVSSGFGQALIQAKEADDTDFSSVFYASLVITAVLYAIIFFTAPLIASFYGNELLTPVLRVMGIRIPVAGINSIQQAYVARQLQFRKFFFATLAGAIVSGAVGIFMAYKGYGVWALVGQYLTNAVMNTIVLWIIVKWRPKLLFSFKRLKGLLSYGWKLLVSALLDTGYNELRSLVIGKKYTSADLAYYDKGKQFPSLIATSVTGSFNTVLLASMSKVQDDREKVKQATRKSIRLSSYILIPCMVGLACVAEPFTKVVLTDKWLPMVPYLQIMCFIYAFYPIHTANLNALQAIGRSDLFLVLEIIKKVIGIGILLATMWFGVWWIAVGMTVSTIISALINAFPNRKLLNYGYLEQIKDLLPAIGISVLMGIPVYFMGYIPINTTLLLVLQIIAGIGLYIGFSALFKVESFRFVVSNIKNALGKHKTKKSEENNSTKVSDEMNEGE